jgi:hypothetical protein
LWSDSIPDERDFITLAGSILDDVDRTAAVVDAGENLLSVSAYGCQRQGDDKIVVTQVSRKCNLRTATREAAMAAFAKSWRRE